MLEEERPLERLKNLCAGISHDLNNFSGIIQGYIELLRLDMQASPDCEAYLERILQACGKIQAKSRTFEEFSNGRQFPLLNMDIEPLLREELAESPRVESRIQAPLPEIPVHPDSVRSIIRELLSNALEATDETVQFEVSYDRESLYCHVSNPGSVSNPQETDCWFDPYYSTRGKGRGFGLSRVHGLVHGHGGKVTVSIMKPNTTQICLQLPRFHSEWDGEG
jgi:signal transduction histidine kinase